MAISETRCNPSITIVVPLLNEAENLPDLLTRIRHALPEENEHLILFVDDGSDDQSLEIIKQSAHEDSSIRYLSLTRNFGHQEALKTGLLHCDTDVVISMDGRWCVSNR